MQLLLFAKTTIWFCCVLVPSDICIAPISTALLGLFYSICTARETQGEQGEHAYSKAMRKL